MEAARLHDYGTPLVIEDVPIPAAGPGPVQEQPDTGVKGFRMAVHHAPEHLRQLVHRVDSGAVTVWVADRRPREDINEVHGDASGGKTVLVP